MANTSLFAGMRGKLIPGAAGRNAHASRAYEYSPRHKLAQLAVTGCLNGTFYASAQDQLSDVLELTRDIDPEFIAKTAVYARRNGYMKDMPALLLATLTVPNAKGEYRPDLVAPVFGAVIDNGKMLRNFVQIMRSGAVGRKSLGTVPKRLVKNWLIKASDKAIIKAMIGNDPSLADVIKMAHPKPADKSRDALFGYIIGREYDFSKLPQAIKDFEVFKKRGGKKLPNVPFQMLTSLELSSNHWAQMALNGGWHMVRMNLNTFKRHGVYEKPANVRAIAKHLSDPEAVRKAKVMPYQIMAAYIATLASDMPAEIGAALKTALDISLANMPELKGHVVICPDVSGSMSWPATGHRGDGTSSVLCIDVAGLMTSAMLRKAEHATVLPFEVCVSDIKLSAKDDVLVNAGMLASVCGGGTNCSAPLVHLNKRRAYADLVIIVSDNQSWADTQRGQGTATMREWAKLKARCPNAKLVCLDIQPYGTSQAAERDDILNIGGFSDRVFDVIGRFNDGNLGGKHWTSVIERLDIRSIN